MESKWFTVEATFSYCVKNMTHIHAHSIEPKLFSNSGCDFLARSQVISRKKGGKKCSNHWLSASHSKLARFEIDNSHKRNSL